MWSDLNTVSPHRSEILSYHISYRLQHLRHLGECMLTILFSIRPNYIAFRIPTTLEVGLTPSHCLVSLTKKC
jgi:hypothetical protein